MKKLLFLLLGVLIALPAFARDFTYEYEGQTITYTVIDEEGRTCETKRGTTKGYWSSSGSHLISGNNVTGDLILPPYPKDGDIEYTLTTISFASFSNLSELTSVQIPSTVTAIENEAFRNCEQLSSITIPDNVETIGDAAFQGCYNLSAIEFGKSINSIGDHAFSSCKKLVYVSLPESLKRIEKEAFRSCENLRSIMIPNLVQYIGEEAFESCRSLEKMAYPSTVSNPFYNKMTYGYQYYGNPCCYPAEDAIIENGFVYSADKSVIYFAPYDLEGDFVIPSSVKTISDNVFKFCSGLTSVEIPNLVESIGENAFRDCSGLTSVVIPNSVQTIGISAFNDCSGLTSFTVADGETTLAFDRAALYNTPIETLYMGRSWTYGSYAAISTGLKKVTLGDQVTAIPGYAFEGCSGLTSVELGNSVETIGSRAFYNCTALSSVEIPNSVQTIGTSAFSGCSALTALTVADGETTLAFGEEALENDPIETLYMGRSWTYAKKDKAISTGIKTVTLGDQVTTIPDYAFEGCSGLTSVVIGNSVETISRLAFNGCSGLTSVEIPNSVQTIGYAAFSVCRGLTSVEIPNSVKTIGDGAFSWCSGLTSVEIGNSVETIGNSAFWVCSGLTSVVIPNSVTTIGYAAFSDCSGLTSFTVADGETTLAFDEEALENDPIETLYMGRSWTYAKKNATISTGIKTITLGDQVTTLPEYAFYLCSGLTSVIIPNSVQTIGYAAFYGCSSLTSVKALGRKPASLGSYAFSNETYSNATLDIPDSTILDYLATDWSKFDNITFDGTATKLYSDDVFKYRLIENEAHDAILVPGNYSNMTEANIPERFTDESDPDNPVRYYVTAIGPNAFKGCTKLRTVKLNSRSILSAIGESAFNGCSALTGINIPATVTEIKDLAFSNCSKLSSITIPEGLTTIGKDAFSGCSAMKYAEFASVEALCKTEFANIAANPLYNAHHLYIAGEEMTDVVIPETIEQLNYTFAGCDAITEITMPKSIKTIGDYALYNCAALPTVRIPESVNTIKEFAFAGCKSLTEIGIPASVESIGNAAFYKCINLDSVALIDSEKAIAFGENVFTNTYIKKLFVGRPFNKGYFRGNTSIKKLIIGNMMTEINEAEFKGCNYISDLTLGSSLVTIGDEAFSGYTALTEVIVPPSVETIGESAFAGNSKLESIIMGHSVKTIGANAFKDAPAKTVSITAQVPPTAPNTTFSSYTGKLWLQDPGDHSVMNAYYDAFTCWDRFDSYALIVPEKVECENVSFTGKPGETFKVTPKFTPENTSLKYLFWRTTNPDIATVDADGIVTLRGSKVGSRAVETCQIIGETLYADVQKIEITVSNTGEVTVPGTGDDDDDDDDNKGDNNDDTTGINEIDSQADYEVYNLNGVKVGDSVDGLVKGIYIVRQGSTVKKIAIK